VRKRGTRAKVQRRYPSLRHRVLANVKLVPAPNWSGLKTRCWIWQGHLNSRGYGLMSVRKPAFAEDGKPLGTKVGQVLVHRLVLKEFLGIEIETVETVMHRCSTKPCCNPDHVDAGTESLNRQFYYTVERPMRLAAGAAA
jgi:hypothetical protein